MYLHRCFADHENCELSKANSKVVMSRLIGDDFQWDRILDDVTKEISSANPRLRPEFDCRSDARSRFRLLLEDESVTSAVSGRVWDVYERFAEGKDDEASAECRNAGNVHFRRVRLKLLRNEY